MDAAVMLESDPPEHPTIVAPPSGDLLTRASDIVRVFVGDTWVPEPRPAPNGEAPETEIERLVLAHADGIATVRDIIDRTGLEPELAFSVVRGLFVQGYVEFVSGVDESDFSRS